MGKADIDPLHVVGTYVEPKDWNDLITRQDVMVIDTRNTYETRIGMFDRAVDPKTRTFRAFPEWADALSADPDRPKAVAMYCTGGIRCEKASAYMKQIGFEEVYHLKGGILKYLEEIPEENSMWQGDCFVFDERVSLKHGLVEGDYDICFACKDPLSKTIASCLALKMGLAATVVSTLILMPRKKSLENASDKFHLPLAEVKTISAKIRCLHNAAAENPVSKPPLSRCA